MEISETLREFINDNIELINKNTKESWEKIYKNKFFFYHFGEFTKIILDSGINDPASIMEYIPEYYLYNASKIKHYIIPSNVVSIGKAAFCDCSSLISVEIPNNVTSIDDSAFSNCSSLESVIIPNSVTRIGTYTFSDCKNLTSVILAIV